MINLKAAVARGLTHQGLPFGSTGALPDALGSGDAPTEDSPADEVTAQSLPTSGWVSLNAIQFLTALAVKGSMHGGVECVEAGDAFALDFNPGLQLIRVTCKALTATHGLLARVNHVPMALVARFILSDPADL